MSGRGQSIRFAGVSRSFGAVRALLATELEVRAGEFLTLLGPSGSGKTTLLNIAAGYLAPTSGRVIVGERDVTELPPRRRNVGMVFQNYALFPHMTVADNVAYGLRARGTPGAERKRRTDTALELVRLEGYGRRRIAELSGGQQQRVALARALVIEPDVLLMDEPLAALDRQLRQHVQLEIRRLHREHGRTTIYVTHDQEEALVMSDRIAIMREGAIEQLGRAEELYRQPQGAFVAGFLGESNLLSGMVTEVGRGRARIRLDGLAREIDGIAADGLRKGPAVALIRPESVRLVTETAGTVAAVLEESIYLGGLVTLRLRLPHGQMILCRRLAGDGQIPSGTVGIEWAPDDVRILPDDALSRAETISKGEA
ncbi:MAG: ABC transporter ATP-binding protein [Proteobacteria bacterium]|nr:ABC transporter ATP-binding protein [Pseudomonadota bacterium]MBI3497928.1 ABC transporter ATP-binding protein [Pseudomonadota bacterium]